MKTTFVAILLGVLGFQAGAFAGITTCSDSTGTVTYTETGYNKGIPPRPGDLLDQVVIKSSGKAVSETDTYKDLDPRVGPIDSVLTDENMLQDFGPANSTVQKYSAKLVLTKDGGAITPAPGIQLPYSDYVICTTITINVP